jgi:hypothetical protein
MSMVTCPKCKKEYPDAFQLYPCCCHCEGPWSKAGLADLGCHLCVFVSGLAFLILFTMYLFRRAS